MKAKLNLSGDGIKRFLFNNGEKLVLGLTVVVLLGFLYSAITAKPVDDSKSPEEIRKISLSKQAIILETGGVPPADAFPDTNVFRRPDDDKKPVVGTRYAWSNEIDPPLFKELTLRTDPALFAVEEVRAQGGAGIVIYNPAAAAPGAGPAAPGAGPAAPAIVARPIAPSYRDAHDEGMEPPRGRFMGGPQGSTLLASDAVIAGVRAKGAQPQAKYWATITALVPLEKQTEVYRRTFEYAFPAGVPEVPRYLGFRVRRAEVKDAADTNINWDAIPPISYTTAFDDLGRWIGHAPELADENYVFPPDALQGNTRLIFYTTWPLPPLYLKNWGVEAVHPKIPLFKIVEAAAAAQQDQTPAVNLDEALAGKGPSPAQLPDPSTQLTTAAPPPQPSYKLFRFVDQSAEGGKSADAGSPPVLEPGKTYRYRVQLILYNPNYVSTTANPNGTPQVQFKHLAKPEGGKSWFVLTPWSEPSAPVTIPRQFQILADSLAQPAREPKPKIDVISMIKTAADTTLAPAVPGAAAPSDVWLEVVKEAEVSLGGIASIVDASIEKVADMTIEQLRKIDKVTIDTNGSMLLDIRNDDPLALNGKKTAPVEMLFIDSNGRLMSTNSSADGLTLKEFKDRTSIPVDISTLPPVGPIPIGGAHGPVPAGRNRIDTGG